MQGVRGHRDNGQERVRLGGGRARLVLPNPFCRLDSVEFGHLNVHENEIVRILSDRFDGLETVARDIGLIAHLLEQTHTDLLIDQVVVDQEDFQRDPFRQISVHPFYAGVRAFGDRRHSERGEHRGAQLWGFDRFGQ